MSETPRQPLVPKSAAIIIGGISTALLALAPFLPVVGGISLGTIASILAFICAAIAGLALPTLTFKSGKPIIPLKLVPVVAGIVPTLMTIAGSLEGVLSVAAEALAYVFAFLAGTAAPTPTRKVNPETKEEVARELAE